jgi:hypothetical protein
MPAFPATWGEPRPRAIPPEHTRPVRGCRQDERRAGGLTGRRRRLTARGVPPGGAAPHGVEGCAVYGAVAPTTGARCFLERPSLHAESGQLVIGALAEACSDRFNILLLDNRGAPTAPRRTIPANVRLVFFPPYGPELSPSARVWRDRKDAPAWRQFLPVDAQPDELGQWLRAYEAPTRQSLTRYAYLGRAIHALFT